jgi:acylphosphatase
MPHRKTYYFDGRVQGVGFRYTAQNIALRYDVGGYVRNLPDGRVEMVLEGEDEILDQVVTNVSRRMNSYIRHIQSSTAPATGEFTEFMIRH